MDKVEVLIVDDHALFRDGIRALLSGYDEIDVVGEASDGSEAIKKALELAPSVILMDLVMPGMNGLEATHRILKKMPKAKVLFLTQYETKEYVLSAIKAGAAGYIPKKALGSELLKAILEINKGNYYLYNSVLPTLIDGYRQSAGSEVYDPLTVREREILKLIAEGHTSREISDMLHISLKTVNNHRLKITKKLGIRNRTELIRYAIHKGLVSVNA